MRYYRPNHLILDTKLLILMDIFFKKSPKEKFSVVDTQIEAKRLCHVFFNRDG